MSPIAACGDSAPAIVKDSARRLPGGALEARLRPSPARPPDPPSAPAPRAHRPISYRCAGAAALRFELPEVTGLNTPEDRNPFNHGEINVNFSFQKGFQ